MKKIRLTPQATPLTLAQGGAHLFLRHCPSGRRFPLVSFQASDTLFGFAENVGDGAWAVEAELLPDTETELGAHDDAAWRSTWVNLLGDIEADDLSTFNHVLWQRLIHKYQNQVAAFASRVADVLSTSQQALDDVKKNVAETLSGTGEVEVLSGALVDQAMQLVANYVGTPLDLSATTLSDNETYLSYLQRVCDLSGVHLRLLKLRGDWWRCCSEAMLAFTADDEPVAILPTRGGQGEIVYVKTGRREKLKADAAAQLQPIGLSLHAVFKAGKKVRARKLFKVGLHNNRWDFFALLATAIVVSLLGLLPPVLTGILVGKAIPNNQLGYLIQIPIVLLVSVVVMFGFNLFKDLLIIRLSTRTVIQLQSACMHRLLQLPVRFFSRYNTGELTSRVLSFREMASTLSGTQINILFSIVFGGANLLLMLFYLPKLAFVVCLCVLFYLLLMSGFSYVRVKVVSDYLAFEAKASGFAFQLLKGIAKLKSTATEALSLKKWSAIFSRSQHCQLRMNRIQKWETLVSQAVSLFVLILIYLLIATGFSSHVTVAHYVAFNSAYLQFFGAIASITMVWNEVLRARVQLKRVKPILEEATESSLAGHVRATLTGAIRFEKVNFRYEENGPEILHDINFSVKPGQFVAIVGASGGGKSTLFRLLLGFEAPASGSIWFDEYPREDLDQANLRRQLGVVLQDAKVLGGSLLDNILGNNLQLGEEDAWRTVKQVGLDQDIAAMPMGMQTILSDGGGVLSGGQRQRLIIARALALQPKVLLFDEATSALDNETQEQVMSSIAALQATRIVIAHRLSTIRNADMVLVLDQGRIVESGGYDDLVAQGGLFAALAQRQLG